MNAPLDTLAAKLRGVMADEPDANVLAIHKSEVLALLDEREDMLTTAEKTVEALAVVVAERDALRAERDALASKINGCQWYWPSDDTSSEMCAEGPWEIAENVDAAPGDIFEYSRGGVVETRWYGSLPPADDADSDDEFTVDEPTEEAALAKMTAEIDRRALTKGTDQ